MTRCHFCAGAVSDDDETAYREVTSWVHGPKLDGPVLREQTGRVAHKACIDKVAHGQAADQPELFEELGLVSIDKIGDPADIQIPDWVKFAADCSNCGTSMAECSTSLTARVCCDKCEHPIRK